MSAGSELAPERAPLGARLRRSLAAPGALALAAPGLVALLIAQALITRPYIDDSYIFYRYAANWAHGLGPVFNAGEYVEGFSSLLWTALLSLGGAAGLSPSGFAPVMGVIFAAATLVLTAWVGRRMLALSSWLVTVAVLAVALSPAFETYASSGMDVILFALVLLAATAACARAAQLGPDRRADVVAGIALVALVLVRAEGPVYALALSVAVSFVAVRRPRGGSRARILLLPGAVVLATLVLLVIRRAVYGVWAPATVLAKGYATHLAGHALHDSSARHALREALSSGVSYAGTWVFVALALAVAGLLVMRRRVDRLATTVAALGVLVVLVTLLVAVWSTGDWMPYRRLLVPVLPLLALLTAWAAGGLVSAALRRMRVAGAWQPAAAGAAGVAALVAAVAAVGISSGANAPEYEAQQLRSLGGLLAASPRPARLLTNLDGILPYYAGARTYVWDMLGLTDLHNAEHGQIFSPRFGRTDPGYDFSRPFDLFVSNSSWDFALLNATLPPGRWLLYSSSAWRAVPLYVVGRAGGALPARVQRLCGCAPVALTPARRRALLAGLRNQGLVPPALLQAARLGRPFPA